MITKTINLDDAYQSLFDEINNKSDGQLHINNIEGFFGNIQEIAALEGGEKFLRLPLDEPLFEIDANTRKINIPEEFKSNGLSVQGDHLAEIVFFSIDRYFDYTDLGDNNIIITINWKMGQKSGKTQNFIMSKDIIPGSIVFGWPIDKVITEKSGSLTFAVEFCKKDAVTGEIAYNFNTLAANITIKDGLILDKDIEATSLNNDILSILTDSVFGQGDAAVGPIQWISGNGQGLVVGLSGVNENEVKLQDYVNPLNLKTVIDSETEENTPRSIAVALYGQAFVDDGTIIKYTDLENHDINANMLKIIPERILVENRNNLDENKLYFSNILDDAPPIDDFEHIDEIENLYTIKALDPNNMYFKLIPNSTPVAYDKATADDIAKWGTINQIDLYVNMAKKIASKAGLYTIRAQGIKQDANGVKIGNGEIVSCIPIEIPEPKSPNSIIIEKSNIDLNIDNDYSIDETVSEKTVFLDNNQATLTASADIEDYGALLFDWKKRAEGDSSFIEIKKDGYKVDSINQEGEIISANNSILEISEPGEYYVTVTNFKNGNTASSTNSDVFKASLPAGRIIDAKVTYQIGDTIFPEYTTTIQYWSITDSMSKRSVYLDIDNIEIDGQTGIIEKQWFREVSDGAGNVELIPQVLRDNKLVISSGDGRFIPVVKNKYNGSIFTYTLNPVDINDNDT